MDPTVTLTLIRDLSAQVLANRTSPQMPSAAVELADAWVDLDGWLSRGGFLPDQWPVPAGLAQPPF